MPERVVLDEYESGWKAIRGEDVFFVQSPTGEEIEFGTSAVVSNDQKTRLFAALCVRFGRLPRHDDPEVVPVDVAAAGKPEVAAYLWAVHDEYYTPEDEFRPVEIGIRLSVSSDTVTEYCRRVIRSVQKERIGGIRQ